MTLATRRSWIVALLAAGVLVGGGCASTVRRAIPSSITLQTVNISIEVPHRIGQMTFAEMQEAAPRIVFLRAEPAALVLRLGEAIAVADHIRVFALDSARQELGELGAFDWSFEGRQVTLQRDGLIRGRSRGRVSYVVRLPAQVRPAGASRIPTVIVPITVSDTASTSPRVSGTGGG